MSAARPVPVGMLTAPAEVLDVPAGTDLAVGAAVAAVSVPAGLRLGRGLAGDVTWQRRPTPGTARPKSTTRFSCHPRWEAKAAELR